MHIYNNVYEYINIHGRGLFTVSGQYSTALTSASASAHSSLSLVGFLR